MVKRKNVRPIWAADCETDPFKKGRIPVPFIWGLYTGEEYYEFTDTAKFIEFIAEHKVIVYAHNGGKFDWHFILPYIDDFEPLTVVAGRLAKFKIGECELRDSYNIIPAPLSSYKKDDIDYAIMERDKRHEPENWKLIRDYLKSDCVYLWDMVQEFIELYGLNLTQAGSAMKVWSKMSGVAAPKSSPGYYEDFSPYYYGGRVQCFEKGIIDGRFSVVDIKSAYPFAMTFKHPWGFVYNQTDELPSSDEEIQKCFITLRAASTGAFPFRDEKGLNFPDDQEIREFNITGWEYLAARDTNTLGNVEIIKVNHFFESISFQKYVEHFYQMKSDAEKAGDAGKRLFAKIFLNSLYGKFASNPENYQEFMTLPSEFLEAATADDWLYCKLVSEETAVVCRQLEEEKRRYYNVAVAASITGFVRAYLWRSINKCGGVLYCDTDSIAARDVSDLSYSKNLGDWDLEAECNGGGIGGKKMYAFRKLDGSWKTASKGVRLTPEEILAVARGEVVEHEPDVPTFSIKTGIKFTSRKIKMS